MLHRRLGALLTLLPSGRRGRPTSILRGCQADTFGGHARFGLSHEEETAPRTVSLAGQVLLPRPFDTFVNATPGPYVSGGGFEALAFNASVMVTPPVSVEPKLELAVSQDGVLIE
jgi:hypothetical protein